MKKYKRTKNMKIRDIQNRIDLLYVSNSQDVEPINEEFNTDYDGFFVKIDGDYEEIYGFYGGVPYLNKDLFRVI